MLANGDDVVMALLAPIDLGGRTAPNRVMFGPHVTNLGDDDRRLTDRHTAYYERRARGGCGIIVVEGASVHPSDWPVERAPLAEVCAPGWSRIASACHAHGALVIASLDHAGGQGSSAYSQQPLWAPSRVPEVNSREVPKWMEPADIASITAGFANAASLAVEAGCDGVELNAGQHSLIRQFLSGLTNHRDDPWGADRTLFAREVIAAVREAAPSAVLGLRLCIDELAPWAGITPEMAPGLAAELTATGVDYLVAVRGSIFSTDKTRPDFHEPTGFNLETTAAVRAAVTVPVIAQGSIVDIDQAEAALSVDAPMADAIEMTRAQIADPDLVAHLMAGTPERIRPCTRCNQTCQVRDARNPIVTCIGEPSSGHETSDPDWYVPAAVGREVVVIGAGPAGLETARVAARRGHRVRVVERRGNPGGLAAVTGPNRALVDWLVAECERTGVTIETGIETGIETSIETNSGFGPEVIVVQATGSQPPRATYRISGDLPILDIAAVERGEVVIPDQGTIAIHDPIGGPIGVAIAERLGDRAVLITSDNIAGNELSRTGDLAPANVRLARAGVGIERRALLREVVDGAVVIEDRFGAGTRQLECVALIDCGFRLPDAPYEHADFQVGDCVAPRTVHEAILEARRAAVAINHPGAVHQRAGQQHA